MESFEINVGPTPATTSGPLHLRVQTDGHRVVQAKIEAGYLHRGMEKVAERMTWLSCQPYMGRIDYVSAIHCEHAYALAVEKLCGFEIPERSKAIRVVVSELSRIASHLLSIAWLARTTNASTAVMFALRDREKICDLFEILCGARLTYNYVRIGGVSNDFTEGFVDKTIEFIDYIVPKLQEYHQLLTNNVFFIGRLAGVGVVSASQAIAAGLSGPNLRASGVKLDKRKQEDYEIYRKIDFSTPLGATSADSFRGAVQGDAFNRYFVRIQEIEQSAVIIRQVLANVPEGKYALTLPRVFKVPAGEIYVSVESPRGTQGIFIRSTGEKYPDRLRLRTPSFPVLNILPAVLESSTLEDMGPLVASFDYLPSEVDR